MIRISDFTTNAELLKALAGRYDTSDKPSKRWCIIGKFVYIDDEESMRNFPYKTYGLHNVNGCYIGMLKE